jgi:hypothetical protein
LFHWVQGEALYQVSRDAIRSHLCLKVFVLCAETSHAQSYLSFLVTLWRLVSFAALSTLPFVHAVQPCGSCEPCRSGSTLSDEFSGYDDCANTGLSWVTIYSSTRPSKEDYEANSYSTRRRSFTTRSLSSHRDVTL